MSLARLVCGSFRGAPDRSRHKASSERGNGGQVLSIDLRFSPLRVVFTRMPNPPPGALLARQGRKGGGYVFRGDGVVGVGPIGAIRHKPSELAVGDCAVSAGSGGCHFAASTASVCSTLYRHRLPSMRLEYAQPQ